MESNQEMAKIQEQHLNGTGDDVELWEDDFTRSTHNLSLKECKGKSLQDHESNLIQKCFELVRKHVLDADPEFILSLLKAEINNPKRLEFVMCEMLNIPNALELIREFKMAPAKAGDKRCMADSNSHSEDAKKKRKDTDSYLQQAKDMFPDADGQFLLRECQQLESWEDFSRFINTVMLSGIYPKKATVESSAKDVDIINISDFSGVDTSEEEISSSGLTETKSRRQKKKGKKEVDMTRVAAFVAEACDYQLKNKEIYGLPSWIRELSSVVEEKTAERKKLLTPTAEVEVVSHSDKNRQTQADVYPTAGPSGEGTRRSVDYSGEKTLVEIIEEKRTDRRKSASGSRVAELQGDTHVETISLDGEEEVSTTTQPTRYGSETEVELEEGGASEEWMAEQTANLIRIFPNTDPSFLREEIVKMKGSSEAVNEFVVAKLERNDMPSRAEYEKKLEMEELQNRYTKNFSIEDFLKAVPEPWVYFAQGNRNCAKYKSHSLCYLKTTFRKRYVKDIIETFNKNNFNLYLSYQDLKKDGKKSRSSQRSIFECNNNRPTTIDIQFLQEVAFIENEDKIKDYLEAAKLERQIKFDEAKRTGSLLECQCCFDSEIMVEDIFYCPRDHAFCKTCIIRSVEVAIGHGRHKFACLANCEEMFTLPCLQNALSPELFSKVIKAVQMEEIRAAEIEDLVQCPFCNYATIMPPEEKVLTCLNPECLKESCRSCKELNHIPLRCDEVEKSEEVKMRTYIENKMTEALVRTCYKCGKKFVKEDGCNKMTCTCGAKMCYVCRKPVSDYSHFNGQGGTEYHKCPLYSTNDELHVEVVRRIGEVAKAEIMQANPNKKLLHDPTALAPERTNQRSLPGVNNGAALDVAMRAIMGTLGAEDGGHRRGRRDVRPEANVHRHGAECQQPNNHPHHHHRQPRHSHNNEHRHHHHHSHYHLL